MTGGVQKKHKSQQHKDRFTTMHLMHTAGARAQTNVVSKTHSARSGMEEISQTIKQYRYSSNLFLQVQCFEALVGSQAFIEQLLLAPYCCCACNHGLKVLTFCTL